MKCVTALAFCLLPSLACAQIQGEASLSGFNEVPPVPTLARGFGTFTLDQPANTISNDVRVTGMSGTMAHLHSGQPGQNGPVVFTLAGGPTAWSGTTAALSPAQLDQFLAEGFYCNVHSAMNQSGQVRGQVVIARKRGFVTTATGGQAVPPSGSNALAVAEFRLNEPGNTLAYEVRSANLSGAVAARLHQGVPGQSGPVVLTLSGGSSEWCGVTAALSPAQVSVLKADGFYMNIETATWPSGEIRGQIINQAASFSARFDGAQAVPPNPGTASGTGSLVYSWASGLLVYSLSVENMSATGAELRLAAPGQSGALLTALAPGAAPNTWAGSAGPFSGSQADALLEGNLAVNVLSAAYPAGEVRAQVRPDPYFFGHGAPGSNGLLPAIGKTGSPTVGASLAVTLANAPASAPAYLFLGWGAADSTVFAQPLPVDLSPSGMPGGMVWIDVDLSFYWTVSADATGCARVPFNIPVDPALEGLAFWFQWLVSDPSANAAGATVSDAIELKILDVVAAGP